MIHRGQLPPKPPPPRVVRDGFIPRPPAVPQKEISGAPPLSFELALFGGLFFFLAMLALAKWAWPDLQAWLGSPVQTSARISCTLPSEHETRLLFVNASADGSIDVACGPMVGTRGSYPGARR